MLSDYRANGRWDERSRVRDIGLRGLRVKGPINSLRLCIKCNPLNQSKLGFIAKFCHAL